MHQSGKKGSIAKNDKKQRARYSCTRPLGSTPFAANSSRIFTAHFAVLCLPTRAASNAYKHPRLGKSPLSASRCFSLLLTRHRQATASLVAWAGMKSFHISPPIYTRISVVSSPSFRLPIVSQSVIHSFFFSWRHTPSLSQMPRAKAKKPRPQDPLKPQEHPH